MLRSVATATSLQLELPGWRRSVAASRLSKWARPSTRGFPCQSPQRSVHTEPRALLRIPKVEESAQAVAERKPHLTSLRRFIASPELARVVASHVYPGHRFEGRGAVLVECDPGPGVLTRTLLNSGARVIALESNHSFLPDLESLKAKLDGQLEVVYCDFFRLDPFSYESKVPPVMDSESLFENLNISPVPWKADVPLKVIGIIPQKRERNLLWKLLYSLYKCNAVYSCGRLELNLFMSEKEFQTLTAKPGGGRPYQALSVLWQTACDIQLLHMEPWSSFLANTSNSRLCIPKSVRLRNDHLCLVRLTPRKDLFTGNLTTVNSTIFIMMVKQYLVKCKTRLLDKLNVWPYVDGKKLLRQLEIPENITTGDLYPEQYKYLFEHIAQSEDFDQSWMSDYLEDYRSITCES